MKTESWLLIKKLTRQTPTIITEVAETIVEVLSAKSIKKLFSTLHVLSLMYDKNRVGSRTPSETPLVTNFWKVSRTHFYRLWGKLLILTVLFHLYRISLISTKVEHVRSCEAHGIIKKFIHYKFFLKYFQMHWEIVRSILLKSMLSGC